ncbi:hypothetical protein O181_125902 [Austropuccinia psidii MF-1]|uniref:Uncharacterized protein n=1 Tax=Austropuccinia psidii MF-1 TaxID=1389203 RepID=A0A9Q3KUW9_9BASI|nr:hypothetical protein [Austropuccinia psidii MF-1]
MGAVHCGPQFVVRGLWAVVCGLWGLLDAPWAQFCWGPRIGPEPKTHPTWPGPIYGFQDHQDPGLPKAAGEALSNAFVPKGAFNLHY